MRAYHVWLMFHNKRHPAVEEQRSRSWLITCAILMVYYITMYINYRLRISLNKHRSKMNQVERPQILFKLCNYVTSLNAMRFFVFIFDTETYIFKLLLNGMNIESFIRTNCINSILSLDNYLIWIIFEYVYKIYRLHF